MQAAEQWREIEKRLPEGWEEVRLSFTVEDPKLVASGAGVLAPLGPGRFGNELRFHMSRSGTSGPESVRNLVERLDRRRIWGSLELVDARVAAASTPETPEPGLARPLVDSWDEALRALPPDWSDLLCELEVDSSDYLPRAALLGAPLNPTRNPAELALRFRVSRRGYGVSPSMARRCFERIDTEGITGSIAVLNALSEVDYVATLGPVWRVAGRSV